MEWVGLVVAVLGLIGTLIKVFMGSAARKRKAEKEEEERKAEAQAEFDAARKLALELSYAKSKSIKASNEKRRDWDSGTKSSTTIH